MPCLAEAATTRSREPVRSAADAACRTATSVAAELDTSVRGLTQVLCGSDERVANHAIRLRSECRRNAGQWACTAAGKEFVLPINGRAVTILFPVALNSWSAYRMAQAVGPMTVPLGEGATDRCALSGDDSDPQIARMNLRCSLWTVEFVKLCQAGGDCRYEPAARRGSERPRSERPRSDERRAPRMVKPGG